MATASSSSSSELAAANPGGRLLSLDVFRGLTILAMILVNNPGQWGKEFQYWPLEHADWHGWTPTDLIFPFFLFIVGTSLAYSLRKYRDGAQVRAGRLLADRAADGAADLSGLVSRPAVPRRSAISVAMKARSTSERFAFSACSCGSGWCISARR